MKKLKQLREFFEFGIWTIKTEETSWYHKLCLSVLKRGVLTTKNYMMERLDYRAAALTYSTLLATVPLLAIIFAISRGFGFNKLIETQIRTNLNAQPEAIDTIIGFVNSYLTHTKSGIFIGFGLLLLFWTLMALTSNIEQAFNKIWQVKRQRSSFRKMTDYGAIFLLLPLFIVLTSSLTVFVSKIVGNMPDFLLLNTFAKFFINLSPFLFIWMAFTGLYIFMPNTHVRTKSALVAGLLAGTAFQAVQFLYLNSQMWVSSYNAIYGSFAALPLFMLLCQISWNICLFGAELTYVDQNIDNFYNGSDAPELNIRYHNFLCLLIASFVCKRFSVGEKPYTAVALATERRIPIRLVNDILYDLCKANVLTEISSDEKGDLSVYQPAKALKLITLGNVLDSLETNGGYEVEEALIKAYPEQWKALTTIRETLFTSHAACKRVDEL
ncbi:MAG: YihY/virulence factor BrkB family protein [Bacteroidaceae bacterium]